MTTNRDRSTHPDWQRVNYLEDVLSALAEIKQRLDVISQHALHADPIHPETSLDQIYVEARQALRGLNAVQQQLGDEAFVTTAAIKTLPFERKASGE